MVCTSETYRRSLSPDLTIRPQEPRRPRFSFFQSSQCQRADPVCVSRRRRRWRQSLRISRTVVLLRLPGSRSALSVNAEQWERVSLGVVSVAGYSRGILACQHPIFNFRKVRNSKSESWNFFFSFRGLLQSLASCGAAVFSDGRVIWAAHLGVNSRK